MDPKFQTTVFVVHAIKQFLFGFETLNNTSDDNEDGSAAKAFYLIAIYNYIAAFFLLDRPDGAPLGGAMSRAFESLKCVDLLDPIQKVVDTRIGGTTFGEIVRVFRNKVIVHTSYCDADLDRIYSLADMQHPAIQEAFNRCLWAIYSEMNSLGLNLVRRMGYDPAGFGISIRDAEEPRSGGSQ